MKTFRSLATLFLCFPLLFSTATEAIITDCEPTPIHRKHKNTEKRIKASRIPYPSIDIEPVFRVFLDAVDKGRLIIYNLRIDRSMIRPEHVEYIYTLNDLTPTVLVYSTPTKPLQLPVKPAMRIEGVSTIIDSQGEITDVYVHCGN